MKKNILVFVLPFIFVSGLLGGYFLHIYSIKCEYNFQFINKSFNCGASHVIEKANLADLKQRLNSYIDLNKKSGSITEASVYFRDLHEGPTLGINDEEVYFSASLLKLPIALVFFKLKEDEAPDILSRIIDFKITEEYKPESQAYKPAKTVGAGKKYTTQDLIFYSLVYSDNLANEVLKSTLNKIDNNRKLALNTFIDLGLVIPKTDEAPDLSTRAYASIFRILYNAAYLNIEDSEKVLSILADSEFDRGISAGVPKDIRVANKFGDRKLENEKQLHDCGIVYYPNNPYLICIMTRGKDLKALEKFIAGMSEMVYAEVDSRKIK